MACDLETIQSQSCTSGIGRLRDKISLLQIIAQLTCEASQGGSSGVLVYRALLNQVGGNAPTATVLENTIGNIVWSRLGPGSYEGTLVGAFPEKKTSVVMTPFVATTVNNWIQYQATRADDDIIEVITTSVNVNLGAAGQIDSILGGDSSGVAIEIRVYP